MKKAVMIAAAATTSAALFWCAAGQCAIPRTNYGYGVDIRTTIVPMESMRSFRAEDIAKMIPCNMTPTDNEGRVAFQILDHSLNSWFKSPEMRNSSIARSANALDNAVDQDFSFGGEEDGSTKHTLRFKMKPIQTRAQLDYSGLVTAQLSYEVSGSRLNFEVSERLDDSTQVVFVHSDTNDDRREMLNLRWQF